MFPSFVAVIVLLTAALIFVQTEAGTVEFRDPKLERSAGLTAADRKWMDDIVNDVNANWDDANPRNPPTLQ